MVEPDKGLEEGIPPPPHMASFQDELAYLLLFSEALLELVPNGVVVLDDRLRVRSSNRAFARAMGFQSANELKGKSAREIELFAAPVAARGNRPLADVLLDLFDEGEDLSLDRVELQGEAGAGRSAWSVRAAPWDTEDSSFRRVLVHVGRQRGEEGGRRSSATHAPFSALSARLLELVPAGVCVLDPALRVRAVSPELARALGREVRSDDSPDQHVFAVLPELRGVQLQELLRRGQHGKGARETLTVSRPDGESLDLDVEIQSVVDADDEVREILLIFHEVHGMSPPPVRTEAVNPIPCSASEIVSSEHLNRWPVPPNSRVLVVEADPWMRMVYSDSLRRKVKGDLVLSETGADALVRHDPAAFGMIVVGLQGDPTDAIEFCRRVTNETPRIPVLAVTEQSADEARAALGTLPVLGALTGPFEREAFREVVAKVLRTANDARGGAGSHEEPGTERPPEPESGSGELEESSGAVAPEQFEVILLGAQDTDVAVLRLLYRLQRIKIRLVFDPDPDAFGLSLAQNLGIPAISGQLTLRLEKPPHAVVLARPELEEHLKALDLHGAVCITRDELELFLVDPESFLATERVRTEGGESPVPTEPLGRDEPDSIPAAFDAPEPEAEPEPLRGPETAEATPLPSEPGVEEAEVDLPPFGSLFPERPEEISALARTPEDHVAPPEPFPGPERIADVGSAFDERVSTPTEPERTEGAPEARPVEAPPLDETPEAPEVPAEAGVERPVEISGPGLTEVETISMAHAVSMPESPVARAVTGDVASLVEAVDLVLDFKRFSAHVLELARNALHAEAGSLLLAGEEEGVIRTVASTREGHAARHPIGESTAGAVFTSGEPMLRRREAQGTGGADTDCAWVPLLSGERVIGVLEVSCDPSAHPLRVEEVQKLAAIGREVGGALEQSWKLRTIHARGVEDALRAEFESVAAGEESLPGRLQRMTTHVIHKLAIETCSIYLHDPRRGELLLRASAGVRLSSADSLSVPVGTGLVGWVARKLKPLVLQSVPSQEDELPQSSAAVPVRYHTDLVGVIAVESTGNLESDRLDLLETISTVIGRQVGESRRLGADESTGFTELGVAFTAVTERKSLARLVAFSTATVIPSDVSTIRLLRPGAAPGSADVLSYELLAAHGASIGGLDDPLVELETRVAREVVARRAPWRVSEGLDAEIERMMKRSNVADLLGIPVLSGEELLGVLSVYRVRDGRHRDRRYDASDADAGLRLGEYVAVAATRFLSPPSA